MSECVYCGEEAGEDYDVCRNCRNKRNVVTIGNKPVMIYIKKILELGTEHNTIIVKTLANNVNVFNYHIKPLFEYWGLEEYKRKWVKEQGKDGVLNSLHITMEMIHPLRGIKTDKSK